MLYGGTLQVKTDEVVCSPPRPSTGEAWKSWRSGSEQQAEADALAFEAHIEFTKVRTALVRALTDLPDGHRRRSSDDATPRPDHQGKQAVSRSGVW